MLGNTLRHDFDHVNKFLLAATSLEVKMLEEGNVLQAVELINDVKQLLVIGQSLVNVIPDTPVEPFPKNFWNQIKWLLKNADLLKVLQIVTNKDPLKSFRDEAAKVATKWGFAY
jgi:hypothetical protein